MAKLLFKLKHVFDDEADEVRQLLSDHKIDFYESPAGNWGISMHALWLKDESQYEQARQLIDEAQAQRSLRIALEREQQKANGELETIAQRMKKQPVLFIIYMAFIIIILYFSIAPFLSIGQ